MGLGGDNVAFSVSVVGLKVSSPTSGIKLAHHPGSFLSNLQQVMHVRGPAEQSTHMAPMCDNCSGVGDGALAPDEINLNRPPMRKTKDTK